ncbi:hypothetical protein [Austwickia chelonae]|uniref:Uncharacterized protein n=1 Tax=Austwickia chelonae NBRC 105200 TaxID=1184607 RepID=K6UML0_9MICO|nr:hypothetical protein [Austwickia chelonae]GAB78206.1 hypothetical protein AUCHE_08_04510 [Austwickia chelonae NBRC 105200]
MTVPALRRTGISMDQDTALANPLTLAVVTPAAAFTGAMTPILGPLRAGAGTAGSIDLWAAGALMIGAIPVVLVLRRRPPQVSDTAHAVGFMILVFASGAAVAAL